MNALAVFLHVLLVSAAPLSRAKIGITKTQPLFVLQWVGAGEGAVVGLDVKSSRGGFKEECL